MAARKNKGPKRISTEAHAFAVVLEEIRANNKVFGEGHQLLREQMERGFDRVDRRLERVENDVGLVKIAVLEHARELKEIRVALEKKVDRHEVEHLIESALARAR